MSTFKEAPPAIQQHEASRRDNRAFEARGGAEGMHLLFAEGALGGLILERVVRDVLGCRAEEVLRDRT